MAAFVKFNAFILNMGQAVHNFGTDALKIYLTNTAPNVGANAVKADLPEIALGNGYTGPQNINNAYSESGGDGTVTGNASNTITAAGGSIGPFRYVVLYNSTKAGGPLIGYWDYGAPLTLNDGATFTVNFDPAILSIL